MRPTLRAWVKTLLYAVLLLAPVPGVAQSLAISHDDLECWPSDLFPVLSGAVSPGDDVRSVRIYFRSEDYPDFYFVDAVVNPVGQIEAVLPLAAPETRRVVYYIEALSQSFESARTQEWTPEVSESDECRRRDPLAAFFQGDVPKIVVGVARAGASTLPPGFLSTGIVGAGAGGVGATTIVAIVGGGIAGGVVVAGGGDNDPSSVTTTAIASQPTTSIPPLTTSSAPSITTTTATPSAPTTTTTSASSTSSVSPATTTTPGTSTTTTTGPASTTTSIPSTTTSVVTTTTSVAPTTTSVPSTTTSAPAGADIAVTLAAPASVTIASLIRYQVVVRNNGPAAASGVRLRVQLPLGLTFQGASGGSCSSSLGAVQCNLGSMSAGGSAAIQITVLTIQLGTITATASANANESDPAPGNNSDSATTRVTLLQRDSSSAFVGLSARLDVAPSDGRDVGQITVGSRLVGIDDTAPVEITWTAEGGESLVEAVLTRASGRSGKWSFELRLSPGIEVDGVQVETGELISSEPRALSFHVRGEMGERVRFRYRLAAREPR